MAKTKVYSLRGMTAGKLTTTFCGVDITLNFRNGMNAYGTAKAVLITKEPFIQDAIEADDRFGTSIALESVYESEVKAKNDFQQNEPVVVDAQSALVARQQAAARKAKKEAEEKMARIREAAAKKAEAKKNEKKNEKKEEPKTPVAEALEFANVNEALTYFLSKGIEVNDGNIADLLKEHNATIKND